MIAEQSGSMVTEITQGVFESFLGIDITPRDSEGSGESSSPAPLGGVTVTSMVHISGAEECMTLSFECSDSLARTVASIMFSTDPAECSEEEISDAIGEIANMIGGNLKSTLHADASLSLPSVVKGAGYQTVIPRSRLRCRIEFECGTEVIVLTVYSPTAAPAGSEV